MFYRNKKNYLNNTHVYAFTLAQTIKKLTFVLMFEQFNLRCVNKDVNKHEWED